MARFTGDTPPREPVKTRPIGFDIMVRNLKDDPTSPTIDEIVAFANGEPSPNAAHARESMYKERWYAGWQTSDFAEAARQLGRSVELDRPE